MRIFLLPTILVSGCHTSTLDPNKWFLIFPGKDNIEIAKQNLTPGHHDRMHVHPVLMFRSDDAELMYTLRPGMVNPGPSIYPFILIFIRINCTLIRCRAPVWFAQPLVHDSFFHYFRPVVIPGSQLHSGAAGRSKNQPAWSMVYEADAKQRQQLIRLPDDVRGMCFFLHLSVWRCHTEEKLTSFSQHNLLPD